MTVIAVIIFTTETLAMCTAGKTAGNYKKKQTG